MSIVQNYYEMQSASVFVSPNRDNFANDEVVQFYYDGAYDAIPKSKADAYLDDGLLNSFSLKDLKGWNSSSGYQYVLFGRYYQDYLDQPILWRVLGIKNGKALLLSELILDTRPFDNNSNEWESSDLRSWLNNSFYNNAFSSTEKSAIVRNSDPGSVFLPSRGELSTKAYGFIHNIYEPDLNRSASGTMYAYDNNLWIVKTSDFTNYYARSKANDKSVDLVASNGKFVLARIDRDNVGVRPAIWVEIDNLPFTNGDGTIEYPYQ